MGKKEYITITIKGFWGRIFCWHDYEYLGTTKTFDSVEDHRDGLVAGGYIRLMCPKCGNIKRHNLC